VQSEYCASVSFYLFWDTDAVGVLRYGLLILFFGPACSRSAALGSLNHVLRTRVQSAALTKHSQIPNEQPRESALPSSIETKADLACVESTSVLSTLSKLGESK